MEDTLIQLLIAIGPAVIVGVFAYYFFNRFIENEDGRRRFLLHKDSQAETLPIRLQAYERLTIFLERIKPSQLLVRVSPSSNEVEAYKNLLISHIEQEFEHNLAQQIYISEEAWNVVKSSKNKTIKLLHETSKKEEVQSAEKLRETVLQLSVEHAAPSTLALQYLHKEIQDLLY